MKDEQLLEIYDREVRREVVPNIVRHVLTGAGSGGGTVSWKPSWWRK